MEPETRLDVRTELLGAARALREAATSHNHVALDCLIRARVLEKIAGSLIAAGALRVVDGGA